MPTKKTRVKSIPTTIERNAAFDALSKPQKRVAIAGDVIAQLDAERYVARNGTYFELVNGYDKESHNNDNDQCRVFVAGEDLQKAINEENAQCTVCGIGACFASAVRLTNEVKVQSDDLGCDDAMVSNGKGDEFFDGKLKEFFDPKQLDLIEVAFECDQCFVETDVSQAQIDAALAFGDRFGTTEETLRAIMQDIIDHRGTFRPGAKSKKTV